VKVMDEVNQAVARRMADPMALENVRKLHFGNLTAPMLAQMREGQVWRSLVDIANRVAVAKANNHRANGNWGPRVPAGGLQLTLTPKLHVNAVLLFGTGPSTIGPDEFRGARVSAAGVTLPEIVMMGCRGRTLGDIVDVGRYNGILGDTKVRRASTSDWCLYLHLDLPLVQPTVEDLEHMRAMHDPMKY
jgi:hypothetical protein